MKGCERAPGKVGWGGNAWRTEELVTKVVEVKVGVEVGVQGKIAEPGMHAAPPKLGGMMEKGCRRGCCRVHGEHAALFYKG